MVGALYSSVLRFTRVGRGVSNGLDADDKVIDRRAIPYPYPTAPKRLTLSRAWSTALDGKTLIRFVIEGV